MGITVLCLALNGLAIASGGGDPEPQYQAAWGPNRPLSQLVSGKLGVVEASWWREPLLLVWHRLNGLPLPPGAFEAADKPVWTGAPLASFFGDKLQPTTANLVTGGSWDSFENCPIDALMQANATLLARERMWGKTSTELKDWVEAQRRVFARCPLGPSHFRTDLPERNEPNPESAKLFLLPEMSLMDPPPGSELLLAKDRAYQRASALLYEGYYVQAEAAFLAIAQDTTSPWRPMGEYLAFRARFRNLQLIELAEPRKNDCKLEECLIRKEELMLKRRNEASRLAADILNAATKIKALKSTVDGRQEITGSTATDLNINLAKNEVKRLMDLRGLVGARLNPEGRFLELAEEIKQPGLNAEAFNRIASDYIILHRRFPPSDSMGEWMTGLIKGTDTWSAACAANSPIKLEQLSTAEDSPDCSRRQWSVESLNRFKRSPTQHAWLFSAAALAQPTDGHVEAVLKALAGVPESHPASSTFMLHRIRLGSRAEALKFAEVLLKRADVTRDPSAINRVRQHRMTHSTVFTEFWADALRIPEAYRDRDTLLREQVSLRSAAYVAIPTEWDEDTRWVLNFELPISVLLATVSDSNWPDLLRTRVAEVALSRAVHLGNASMSRRALQLLSEIKQSGSMEEIAKLRKIENDYSFLLHSKLLATDLTISNSCLIKVPDKAAAIAIDGPAAVYQRHPGRFARQILPIADAADWKKERKALDLLPDQDALWMKGVLDFAAVFPEDLRVPSLLRKVIYKTRLNSCTAKSSGDLSKRAFILLKSRYASSREARKTTYWFSPY